jgi:hypothetical protein
MREALAWYGCEAAMKRKLGKIMAQHTLSGWVRVDKGAYLIYLIGNIFISQNSHEQPRSSATQDCIYRVGRRRLSGEFIEKSIRERNPHAS